MSFKKKIVIIGPFNTRGGREIEAGFIATTLAQHYHVTLYSTEYLEKDNDILSVDANLTIYRKNKRLNFSLFKKKIRKKRDGLSFKSLKSKDLITLEQVISKADLVLVLAQVLSLHIDKIILLSKQYYKPVVFRTTGTIPLLQREFNGVKYDLKYLEIVDEFLHHTMQNADSLSRVISHNYTVIDQSVVKESELKTLRKKRSKISKFYTCSRLDKNKSVETVVKVFNSLSGSGLELNIYGDGYELERLKALATNKKIQFHGHVAHTTLFNKINENDCLIISSKEEAGPYTALEAMCLGIPVLSTKVGSMPIRFKELNNIWFAHNDIDGLKQSIIQFSQMNKIEVEKTQSKLLNIYDTTYCNSIIEKKYLKVISSILN